MVGRLAQVRLVYPARACFMLRVYVYVNCVLQLHDIHTDGLRTPPPFIPPPHRGAILVLRVIALGGAVRDATAIRLCRPQSGPIHSSGVLGPLLELQRTQHGARLSGSSAPPRLRGITWSIWRMLTFSPQ